GLDSAGGPHGFLRIGGKERRRPLAEAHISLTLASWLLLLPHLVVVVIRFRVRSSDSKVPYVQTNCRVVHHKSYSCRRSLCNLKVDGPLDDILREALPDECPSCAGAAAEPFCERRGALLLRRHRSERRFGDLLGHAAPREIGTDRGVRRAAVGEHSCALAGGPLVVEIARFRRPRQRLGPRLGVEPGAREPLFQLGRRQVAPRERVDDDRECVLRHAFAAAGSSSVSAALASGSTGSTSSACAAAGSSRAETTCPSSACIWIRWRIAWQTSGCSRRKAVAFCRPWPSRSSSKLKYEPDFCTIFRSRPTSSTVPSQE